MPEEKREKNNNRILIIGVSFFAILFGFLWLFNVQRIIFSGLEENSQESENQFWRDIQQEFSDSFTEMNLVWEEAQSSQIREEGEAFLGNFKNMIEEELVKPEDNDSHLTQWPSNDEEVIKSIDYCPEYVNCMPTYDELPEDFCVVPPGCEDITIKVY